MNNKIAVLLTCHNRCEKTISCLKSLYNCHLPNKLEFNVFLVDDGSTDGTGMAVKENFPTVNIIQGNGNLFWNRGMHLAWETAAKTYDFDFYLWLNDDTYLFPNAIDSLIAAANLKGNDAIIVAATCSKQFNELTYSGFLINGIKVMPTNELVQVATFNGNCILIPRHVFRKVGNLDPLFCHCIGDFDYGYRALKHGIKSFVAPGFLAYCEKHDALPLWCIREVPFQKRIRSLYSPLGNSSPYYFFRYELRHFGILIAMKHFLSIHLRVILPKLWK